MADSTPLSTNVDTAPLSTNVDNMTHDLMCPFPFLCLCDFIAKVRADECARIIGVMERNVDSDGIEIIDAVLDMTFLSMPRGES